MLKSNNTKLFAYLLFILAVACSACVKAVPGEQSMLSVEPKPVLEGISSDGLLITEGITEQVLMAAYSQVGTPYRYGGISPYKGFDCSGFTRWVYLQNGIQLPRTSKEQFKVGRSIEKSELKPGDLLMYKRGRRGSGTHIGIYVGDGKYIHSPSRGKTVREDNAFNPLSSLRFLGARRVFEDPVLYSLSDELKLNAKKTFVQQKDVKIKVVLTPSGKKSLKNKNTKKSKPKETKANSDKKQASNDNSNLKNS